jgi:hypothetical protein
MFGFNDASIVRMKISDAPGDKSGYGCAMEGIAIERRVAAL